MTTNTKQSEPETASEIVDVGDDLFFVYDDMIAWIIEPKIQDATIRTNNKEEEEEEEVVEEDDDEE